MLFIVLKLLLNSSYELMKLVLSNTNFFIFLLTLLFYNLSFFNSSRSYKKDRKSILTVSLRKTNVLFKILIHPTSQYELTTHPSHSTTECIFSVSPNLPFPIISIIITKQKLHAYLNFIVSYT